jgi:hypothetical protein
LPKVSLRMSVKGYIFPLICVVYTRL